MPSSVSGTEFIFHTRLKGNAHVEYTAGKTMTRNLLRLMPRVRRPSKSLTHLMAPVAESVAPCAAPVWTHLTFGNKRKRRTPLSAQKTVAIKISRAHQAVSTEAIPVLAKMPPPDLLPKKRTERQLEEKLEVTTARKIYCGNGNKKRCDIYFKINQKHGYAIPSIATNYDRPYVYLI